MGRQKHGRDKRIVRISRTDQVAAIAYGLLADIGVAAVFYDSAFGMIPGIAVGIYVYRLEKKRSAKKTKELMTAQFRTLLLSMTGTLEAGYALVNSFISAGEDCRRVYGQRCEIGKAIDNLRQRMSLNMSFEDSLRQMNEDFQIEEMRDFSVVVAQASRTGGNMIKIIRDTAEKIVSGIELKEELGTMIAARQLEQRIMTFMPAGIILLLRLSSPGFMDMLFGNVFGILIMSAAVGLNVLADFIGKRIVGRLEI